MQNEQKDKEDNLDWEKWVTAGTTNDLGAGLPRELDHALAWKGIMMEERCH